MIELISGFLLFVIFLCFLGGILLVFEVENLDKGRWIDALAGLALYLFYGTVVIGVVGVFLFLLGQAWLAA